jgi:hypothetical protein
MAGRVPLGSGANQSRVFIDLTDETDPGDSEVVSACTHPSQSKTALLEPTFPLAPYGPTILFFVLFFMPISLPFSPICLPNY